MRKKSFCFKNNLKMKTKKIFLLLNLLSSLKKMFKPVHLFLFICIIILAACSTSRNQPTRPVENYQAPVTTEVKASNVNIPIHFKASELERLFNNKMTGVIYDDNNLEDDGMMMKVTKTQNVSIHLQGFEMVYRVPLKIWVFRKLVDNFLMGKRGVEAEGELALTFKTALDIRGDWSLEPHTDVVNYEWIHNMAVKTGIGNMDVKYLADIIIDRSKATITDGIDKQIRSQFQLRKSLEDAWAMMQQPISKVNSYGTWWVKLTPLNIEMAPMSAADDVISTNINISTLVEVKSGTDQPVFRGNTYLPPFRMGQPVNNDFAVSLVTEIPIKEAERIAKSYAVDQVYTPAGKTIKVTNVELFGQNDKIIVNTYFTGSYNGSLFMVGKPTFNAQKNTIELADLDYELHTKNFLINTARWMFDRTILKKMQEACVFKLDDNIAYFKTMTNDMLRDYKYNNNVSLQGAVDDIVVDNIMLKKIISAYLFHLKEN